MEVKDGDGDWVRVPDNLQFPLLDVTPNRFVVNLTGLFPTNDYSIRIHTFFNAPLDYIGVDNNCTPSQDILQQPLHYYLCYIAYQVANVLKVDRKKAFPQQECFYIFCVALS